MEFTNEYGLPKAIYDAVTKGGYDNPEGLSVTTLISPALQRRLIADYGHNVKSDVSDRLWALLGTSVHYILEQADSSIIKELRLFKEIDGQLISGKADYYDPVEKHLADFKVTSKYAVKYGKPKPEWEAQLNILAYLFEAHGLQVNTLGITAILRDWMNTDKLKHDFPDIPFMQIKVKKWSTDETLQYIKDRIGLHTRAFSLPIAMIPICSPEERWRSEASYALMKNNQKKAVKLFDTYEDAVEYALAKGYILSHQASLYSIETREGTDRRCAEYCPVKQYCHYAITQGY